MNWVRFGLTGAYAIIVFIFFFAYIAGFVNTSNLANDILYIGGLIMLGIIEPFYRVQIGLPIRSPVV